MSGAAQDTDTVRSAVPLADLSALDAALKKGDEAVREALRKLRPADVGKDLSRRTVAECERLVAQSDDRAAAAMLRAAHPGVAAKVVEALDPQRVGRVLGFLPTDHQVTILGAVPATVRERIEASFSVAEKERVDRLLAFPEGAVARLMMPRVWKVPATATAGEAMDVLRKGKDSIEVAQNCHVVDYRDRLVGVAALRELAVADPATPVAATLLIAPFIPTTFDYIRGLVSAFVIKLLGACAPKRSFRT